MRTTLSEILTYVRVRRNFDPSSFLLAKTTKIEEFLTNMGINAIVLGVSGGIDSALVLAIMKEINSHRPGRLKKILPLFMPIHSQGTTGQGQAMKRAMELVDFFGLQFYQVDLSISLVDMLDQCKLKPEEQIPWAIGQAASIMRTPVLYYQAAVLQTMGYKSLVCGTTNRDEGSYIGFFGKASDAMVDLQPIADMHKSEVISLAKHLNVPQSIIDATPKGDVWDGRVDEEMIGAPYWFLELYTSLKEWDELHRLEKLYGQEYTDHVNWVCNIENIHKTNAHKYEVGSPAHFVDVLPRKIPGGWQ